jgi:arylsulfatase A-like enzyme
MSEQDVAFLNALYDSEIAFTDHHIGRLLKELRRLELYQDALIVFTADHGEELMDRGWIGHSITLHQELIRVPLIVKLPSGPTGVPESPVGLIDVMPTILLHCGIEVPDGLEGEPLELDPPDSIPSHPLFSETFNPQVHRPEPVAPLALRSVVLGTHKLIHDQLGGRTWFYDLAADPGERQDLSTAPLELRGTMAAMLTEWRESVEASEIHRQDAPRPDAEELLTPEQIEQLKALGYL